MDFKKFLKEHWPLGALILFFGALFAFLLYTHMLWQKPDGLYSGGSTWGDLAFHLTLESNFWQSGLNLKSDPTYAGTPLAYPFLFDLITARLQNLGINLQWALIIPSFIFILFFIVIFYWLAFKITKSKWAAFLAQFIFFFNGSIFGLYYFWKDWNVSSMGFWTFLNSLQKEYANLADFSIRFSNVICDIFLPQRSFIPGFAIGTLALYFLWKYWENKKRNDLIYAGIAISFLPLLHTHTFVALILVCAFLSIIQLSTEFSKKIFWDWVCFAVPVLALGLPQFLLIFPFGKQSFVKMQFGWMAHGDSILWFWIKNLTPQIFLILAAWFFAEKKFAKFYLAFFCVFILSNIIIFQPHDYDNYKIMLWWFLPSCILMGQFLVLIFKRFKIWGPVIVVTLFFTLTVTGVISVYRESYTSWRLFSNEDIALANFVDKNTPKDAVFLTSDTHNHPIPCLAGRQILMGYRGWLWTHGIDYRQRESDAISMFSGAQGAKDLIKKYNLKYAVLDKGRSRDFRMDQTFFDQNFKLIYSSENLRLYQL